MLTPVLSLTLPFTSDGTSTALEVDLSTSPTNVDLTGVQPLQIQKLALAGTGGVALPEVSATIVGKVATFTFNTAPPMLDGNSALVTYTLTFLLTLTSIS